MLPHKPHINTCYICYCVVMYITIQLTSIILFSNYIIYIYKFIIFILKTKFCSHLCKYYTLYTIGLSGHLSIKHNPVKDPQNSE